MADPADADRLPPRLLREVWRENRRPAVAAAALTSLHQLAEVAVPVVIGLAIDRALDTGDGGAMVSWLAVLVILFASLSFTGCMGLYMGERAVTDATHQMRLRIASRALDRRGVAAETRPGALVSMSSVDAERLAEGLGALMFSVAAVAGILAATTYLLTTSLSLGLIIILGLPVLLLFIQVLAQPLTVRAEQQQETVARAAAVATDLFSGLRPLKGLGAEAAAARQYRRVSATALDAALDANRARGIYHGIVLGLSSGFLALVAWIGGRQALDGTITVAPGAFSGPGGTM
jgi:ABC-type multidrug transport system fused ATPase/permease subunit